MKKVKNLVFKFFYKIYILLWIPLLFFISVIARLFSKRKIDVGLGPDPLINNVYHKKSLEEYGFTAETFVRRVYFITDEFDVRADLWFKSELLKYLFVDLMLFVMVLFRYKCIYIYFNGGPLYTKKILRNLEPTLLKLSGIKVVVMPYGGDVYIMDKTNNLPLRHAMNVDYPSYYESYSMVKKQVIRWTNNADCVISGCDWVDYTYHWDRLMLAHFSIDLRKFEKYKFLETKKRIYTKENPLRVLHAPNHKTIKGTSFFISAVEELKNEGYHIELVLIQKRPNHEVIEEISKADVIADQLIIGWYAMFSLESMAVGKPIICYLRKDLIDLYKFAGILESEAELPFLNSNHNDIKSTFLSILNNEVDLMEYQKKSRRFVEKFHSTQAVGKVYSEINSSLDIHPS